MKISIEYCMEWNYEPRAFSLRDKLSNLFGIKSELIESGGGVFEVRLNDQFIFSKRQLGRFPEEGEIENFIQGIEDVT